MGIKFIEQKWLFLFGVEGEVWLADWGQSADFWFGFGFHLFRTARASSIRVDLKSGERGMCAVVRKAVRADRRMDRKSTQTFQGLL